MRLFYKILYGLLIFLTGSHFYACKQEVDQGALLAQKYCTSCHLLPEPELLTKDVWEDYVLPKMGARLGMKMSKAEISHGRLLQSLGVAPNSELMEMGEWMQIKAYFLANAPDTLFDEKSEQEVSTDLSLFSFNPLLISPSITSTSLLHITKKNELIIGDGLNYGLYRYNFLNQQIDSIGLSGAPSAIHMEDTLILDVLTMGRMTPNDFLEGEITQFDNDFSQTSHSLLKDLRRPVHYLYYDMNEDGYEDIVVCSFGNILGSFSWFEYKDSTYTQHVIINEPGAIKAEMQDLNGDGRKDIIVLMAQGREGLYWFKNLGGGRFSTINIIQEFQPSFGSSYFEMADFNKDGALDILYCNGDNGDYPPLMKPYHGIHILMNVSNGENVRFEEDKFLHFDGVYKALARDFDLDGDLDIAALSYFPDYSDGKIGSFIYFENRKNTFYAKTGEIGQLGKWLVMDAGDVDDDGDIDVILGSSSMMTADVPQALKTKWKQNNTSIYLLSNLTY